MSGHLSGIPSKPTDPILYNAQQALLQANKIHPPNHPGVIKLQSLVRVLKDPVFQQIYRANVELEPYFQELNGRYIDPASGHYQVNFRKQPGANLGFSISRDNETGNKLVLFVDSVVPNGIAYFKGVREGDIFLRVNNQPITSQQMFQDAMKNFEKSGSVEFVLVRKIVHGDEQTLTTQDQTEVIFLENHGSGFGFAIVVVGYEIQIKIIVAGGSAALDGRMKLGDRLIAIHGQSTEGMDSTTVVSELKKAGKLVSLTIWRQAPLDYPIRYDDSGEIIHVSLTKDLTQSLGINICDVSEVETEDHVDTGLFIKDVIKGSVADQSGKIRSLDQIIAVNQKTLTHLPKNAALPILKAETNIIHFTFLRRRLISFKENVINGEFGQFVENRVYPSDPVKRWSEKLGPEFSVYRADCPSDDLIAMIRPYNIEDELRYRIDYQKYDSPPGTDFEAGDEILEIDSEIVIGQEDLLSKLQTSRDSFKRVLYARRNNHEYSSVNTFTRANFDDDEVIAGSNPYLSSSNKFLANSANEFNAYNSRDTTPSPRTDPKKSLIDDHYQELKPVDDDHYQTIPDKPTHEFNEITSAAESMSLHSHGSYTTRSTERLFKNEPKMSSPKKSRKIGVFTSKNNKTELDIDDHYQTPHLEDDQHHTPHLEDDQHHTPHLEDDHYQTPHLEDDHYHTPHLEKDPPKFRKNKKDNLSRSFESPLNPKLTTFKGPKHSDVSPEITRKAKSDKNQNFLFDSSMKLSKSEHYEENNLRESVPKRSKNKKSKEFQSDNIFRSSLHGKSGMYEEPFYHDVEEQYDRNLRQEDLFEPPIQTQGGFYDEPQYSESAPVKHKHKSNAGKNSELMSFEPPIVVQQNTTKEMLFSESPKRNSSKTNALTFSDSRNLTIERDNEEFSTNRGLFIDFDDDSKKSSKKDKKLRSQREDRLSFESPVEASGFTFGVKRESFKKEKDKFEKSSFKERKFEQPKMKSFPSFGGELNVKSDEDFKYQTSTMNESILSQEAPSMNNEYDEYRISMITEYEATMPQETLMRSPDETIETVDEEDDNLHEFDEWENHIKICKIEKTKAGFGMNIAQFYNRSGDPIVVVESLLPGGIAAKSGVIAENDRIVMIENHDTSTFTAKDLAQLIINFPFGSKVKVGLQAYKNSDIIDDGIYESCNSELEPEEYKSSEAGSQLNLKESITADESSSTFDETQADLQSEKSSKTSHSLETSKTTSRSEQTSATTRTDSTFKHNQSEEVSTVGRKSPHSPSYSGETSKISRKTGDITHSPTTSELDQSRKSFEDNRSPISVFERETQSQLSRENSEKSLEVQSPISVFEMEHEPRFSRENSKNTFDDNLSPISVFGDEEAFLSNEPPLASDWPEEIFQSITLQKSSGQSLGIMLQKPKDSQGIGMLIKSTQEGSLVDADGRLQAGDLLVGINEESLVDLTISEARKTLQKVCTSTSNITLFFVAREDSEFFLKHRKLPPNLTIRKHSYNTSAEALGEEESEDERRDHDRPTSRSSSQKSLPHAEPSFDNVTFGKKQFVEIERIEGKSLGLSIVDYSIGIIVSDVLDGSPADNAKSGVIQPWDRINSVNGEDVTRSSRAEAIKIIQTARSPLVFVVQPIIFLDDDENNQQDDVSGGGGGISDSDSTQDM